MFIMHICIVHEANCVSLSLISLLFFLLNISAVENIQSKIHDMSDIVRITTSLIIIFWQWIGISVEGAGGEQ